MLYQIFRVILAILSAYVAARYARIYWTGSNRLLMSRRFSDLVVACLAVGIGVRTTVEATSYVPWFTGSWVTLFYLVVLTLAAISISRRYRAGYVGFSDRQRAQNETSARLALRAHETASPAAEQ